MDAAADTTSQSDDRFIPHNQFQPIGKFYKRSHSVSANSKTNAFYSRNNIKYNILLTFTTMSHIESNLSLDKQPVKECAISFL